MPTADDEQVLDQLESDLLAVEAALAELDRLAESEAVGSADVHPGQSDQLGQPGQERVDGQGVGREFAIRAVLADARFVTGSAEGEMVAPTTGDASHAQEARIGDVPVGSGSPAITPTPEGDGPGVTDEPRPFY